MTKKLALAFSGKTDIQNNQEDYYRAVSEVARYRHKEALIKELLTYLADNDRIRLAEEKKKADLLLENILPKYMIEELKTTGRVTPIHHDQAAVMFTDFVGFSDISRYMSPNELLKELTIYFDEFERICVKYDIEKVKTVGDAFLCVAGIGKHKRTAVIDIVMAGMEMLQFVEERKMIKERKGEMAWGMRASINKGSVIAGIVGQTKIAFDVWGHSVNIASRINTVGKDGAITVSRDVYDSTRDFFDCTFYDNRLLKGMGYHDLYLINGFKKKLSVPKSEKTLPNKSFFKIHSALRKGHHVLYKDGKFYIKAPQEQTRKLSTTSHEIEEYNYSVSK